MTVTDKTPTRAEGAYKGNPNPIVRKGKIRRPVVMPPEIDKLIQEECSHSSMSLSEATCKLIAAGARALKREREAPAEILLEVVSEAANRPVTSGMMKDLSQKVESLERHLKRFDEVQVQTLEFLSQLSDLGGNRNLKMLVIEHQQWLLEHQRDLTQTYVSAEKALADMRPLLGSFQELQKQFDFAARSGKGTLEGYQRYVREQVAQVALHTEEALQLATQRSQEASSLVKGHSEAVSALVEKLNSGTSLFLKRLRLTPLTAIVAVVAMSAFATMTTVYFIPTFERLQTESIINKSIAPLIEAHFKSLAEKQDSVLDAHFRNQSKKYNEFVARYKEDISGYQSRISELGKHISQQRDIIQKQRAYLQGTLRGFAYDYSWLPLALFVVCVLATGGVLWSRFKRDQNAE